MVSRQHVADASSRLQNGPVNMKTIKQCDISRTAQPTGGCWCSDTISDTIAACGWQEAYSLPLPRKNEQLV